MVFWRVCFTFVTWIVKQILKVTWVKFIMCRIYALGEKKILIVTFN